MGKVLLLLAAAAAPIGCGADDVGDSAAMAPDAAVIAAPDASATPDAAACPPQFQSCASLNCGEPLDCPWADSLSAPCACAEPTGLIHYCVRP